MDTASLPTLRYVSPHLADLNRAIDQQKTLMRATTASTYGTHVYMFKKSQVLAIRTETDHECWKKLTSQKDHELPEG